VHHFVTHIEIRTIDGLEEPLIRFRAVLSDPQARFLDALQKLVVEQVIRTPNVQHLEFKGQKMVVSVFEALCSDPSSLLPEDARQLYAASGNDVRVICDYVAGMTDGFLLKTYDRLFSPRMGSVFDKL
jgi:dGTPase